MSEEIPPSSLVTPPARSAVAPNPGARYTLRLTAERWAAVPAGPPTKAAATVLGAWLVLAWNRFGFQGLAEPRVLVRFVLVGVYGWLGLVAFTWVGHRLLVARRAEGLVPQNAQHHGRLLQVIGLSHLALLTLAVVIQIGQAIPIPVVVPAITAFTLIVWFPGMLVVATREAADRVWAGQAGAGGWAATVLVAVAGYLIWFGVVGRYLLDQLGHLI